jgi:APA family basic amino acid/polyamine antiporter
MQKLGFWPVFALVTGSQIGTGILMVPANLASYGFYSFLGWALSACGAIFLALVFAQLCAKFPRTGGPHAYIQMAFGTRSAFITAWTYWIISWASTAAVIIGCIGYLTPLIGDHGPLVRLILQLTLLFMIVFVNLKGVSAAGSAEVFLSALKFIPLFVLPLIALFFFSPANIITLETHTSTFDMIMRTALLTMWCFVGVETATTPAGSVHEPHKTIPRALVAGTVSVAFLYIFNSLGIMGCLPAKLLSTSQAPYTDATYAIFNSSICSNLISLIASIICLGTLNAWVLSSSQVALGASQDGFFPKFFQNRNQNGAARWSIIASSVGLVPILCLTADDNVANQILTVIDISVTAFLFVYLFCSFALMKFMIKEKEKSWIKWIYVFGASSFCLFVISATPFNNLCIALVLPVSGCLISFFMKRKIF